MIKLLPESFTSNSWKGFFFSNNGGLWMFSYKEENGQGLIEYALIITLVTLIVIIMLTLLGPAIRNAYSNIIQGL
jgi:Flp pilus assembly pilin Flp